MDINLTDTMNCLKAVIPRMNRGSSIVNVSSVLGQGGIPKGSDYGASKAGVISITKCAARELAGKGIRINAIAP
jgi:3-oxoacyl-[acyl-carrier protein] reductase